MSTLTSSCAWICYPQVASINATSFIAKTTTVAPQSKYNPLLSLHAH